MGLAQVSLVLELYSLGIKWKEKWMSNASSEDKDYSTTVHNMLLDAHIKDLWAVESTIFSQPALSLDGTGLKSES